MNSTVQSDISLSSFSDGSSIQDGRFGMNSITISMIMSLIWNATMNLLGFL